MRFIWDPKKAKSNLKKHGVSFEEATTIFDDPFADFIPDPDHSSHAEERQIALGESKDNKIVVVVHVELIEGELFRIVSARKATDREELSYWRKRV
jgi:uncharacterized DUF497 family protein